MTLQTLVVRYASFAALATIANLTAQRLVLWLGDSTTMFAVAVGTGTFVGLLIKYLLDKRWIFEDHSSGFKAHSRKFSAYTALGMMTTGIFWGTETAFWLHWQSDTMRELGAIIGLSIGYIIKYNLDRKFVFTNVKLVHVT